MKSVLSFLVLLGLLSAHAEAQTPISIPDPGLKTAIENVLWVTDPTPTDMLGLTSLEGQACSITNLTGLEYAVNLQNLSLRFNQISDLQPLAGLHNLSSLSLNDNRVSDVSPLSGLASLYLLD
ncbi:MAG: leucine-rich repeat domain-containing protein, partial [Solirubrobacterales bacterium]